MCAAVTSTMPSTSEDENTTASSIVLPTVDALASLLPTTVTIASGGVGGGNGVVNKNPAVCRYYLRGICRFGIYCRFSHDANGGEIINCTGANDGSCATEASTSAAANIIGERKKLSSWANAPAFVPSGKKLSEISNGNMFAATISADSDCNDETNAGARASAFVGSGKKTWAAVVGGDQPNAEGRMGYVQFSSPGSVALLCPFETPCPYGDYCAYAMHLELCKMCDLYCLHPTDIEQRRKHNQECLQQHEKDMELSFAIARSRDKTCGICMDTIMEKAGREKRFGILPNCTHIFCLECIRKWRQAKQFEHKITRSCPECRIASDFVCPSAFWVETKEEKEKLLSDYRAALGGKDCKYFKKGNGKCPFGNKCFYKHALDNGELVDVGCPRRARKLIRQTDEIIDLLDIYLWDFVDHRDFNFLDLLTSDSSDDSEYDYDI